ncbi:hypothetical protein [Wenxinia marina]|uniref:Glycine-zipper n=1 Tax=Wenxinia marina DSM 24838 TaxID=1123501 RepID=A0A0D0Q9W2_9RHOB|nr:hypothetical protein [Wenxinia marina]KIQ71194.1 Glycine-zipper [Wenxinia marina DSM 24838]GGL81750.1 hypothetical protein GCM10011392_40440 [Wenxinia marina]
MKPLSLTILLPLLLAACADGGSDYTPIVDGVSTAAFQSDLAACQALSRDQRAFDQETAAAAALGAGVGALLGAADDDATAASGAIAGALAGGVASAVDVSDQREAIVVECLRGRGHRVAG